ncbi:MAG: SLC26A/SulP transporter family protein [Gammaproteobacteria bacterium]|nr:SLC26A/SulP transporter family protein [Gammaproteobacteria bacterium]
MLVALPASIAFGVAVYTPFGASAAAQGAVAGILGATALGIVAPIFGGTDRLISAPCAPAAAVMGALAMELMSNGGGADPAHALVLMALTAVMSAGLQIVYGLLGGGTLIKYIPYPVVTGYLSGVGVVIFLKQLPGLFGLPKGMHLSAGLMDPALWRWQALVVGAAAILVMALAPRVTRRVPAAILGLGAGVLGYFGLGFLDPALRELAGNPLVIGPIGASATAIAAGFASRWSGLASLELADFTRIAMPALTLSVLLSIDTLKTCVVVDAMTRSRHDSNREIIGQGLANLASACLGGMPGAGTSGATLVNIASGGRTRASSILEGVFVLLAFLLLGRLVAWAPIAALSGILIVVAVRMFDWSSVRLLKQKSTILDFVVIAAVIAVAVGIGLITASGVGIALAIVLFIREQTRRTVIHRKVYGNQVSSRQKRLPEDMAILEQRGHEAVVCELEGTLFFGTTDQLLTQLAADLESRRFVILDMRRVRGVDFTAVHILEQMQAQLGERGGELIFSDLPKTLPSGEDLNAYFDEVGLVKPEHHIRIYPQLSDALEAVEDQLLAEAGHGESADEIPLELRDFDFVAGRKEETLQAFAACVEERHCEPGEAIFRQGEMSDELFFVRRGSVRVLLKAGGASEFHIATFGRGDFFGDLAFLDRGQRSADAIAERVTDLFVISRQRFDEVAKLHPRLAQHFFASMAHSIALRLRHADGELQALREA